LIGTFVYYFLIAEKIISSPLLTRYTAGHPVEYIEVALFFMGLVAIVNRAVNAFKQSSASHAIEFKHRSAGKLSERIGPLLAQLEALPGRLRHSDFARRIENALVHVKHNDSTENLEDEIKYLSELDAEKNHQSYALVRMIIWATPMLGFLGTVIGITLALGDLSPEALVNSPKEAMEGLLAGLSVAFDTTALALSLSIVLMFAQFLAQQLDTQLLTLIDRRTVDELSGYFRASKSASSDEDSVGVVEQVSVQISRAVEQASEGLVSGVERASSELVAGVERASGDLVSSVRAVHEGQADTLAKTMGESLEQWQSRVGRTGESIEQTLSSIVESVFHGTVRESLELHAEQLGKLEDSAGEAARENWDRWHETASEMLRQMRTQQAELTRHGEILNQTLHATGQVMNLEKALNQNLRALAHAKNFEDTVMSLSAAIQLLSSRMNRPLSRDAKVKLEASAVEQERAA